MTDDEHARVPADPAYAAAIGLVPAPWGRRVLAFCLDLLLVAIVSLPLALGVVPAFLGAGLAVAKGADPLALVRSGALSGALLWYAVGQGGLLILVLVQLILHGRRGRTVGKAICGLRSISVRTFARPGVGRALLRGLVLWAAAGLVPILGAVPFLVSPAWNVRRRGWLDRIGGSWLVDVRRGLDPLDAKALRLARKRVDSPPVEPDAPLPSLATSRSGSFADYLPSTRSSSGVVSPVPDPAPAWTPPVLGGADALTDPPRDDGGAASGVLAVLVLDDGARIPLRGSRVLGRSPQSLDDAEALVVDDLSMQLSKTHALIGVDAEGAWVEDRHSANGTVLLAEQGETVLGPGLRHRVPWGASLLAGGRRIRVEAPPESRCEDPASALEKTERA